MEYLKTISDVGSIGKKIYLKTFRTDIVLDRGNVTCWTNKPSFRRPEQFALVLWQLRQEKH
jgi:hypothetical protein